MQYLKDKRTGRRTAFLTRDEVMDLYGISKRTLYRWMGQGMPSLKLGYWILFPQTEVRNWIHEHYPADPGANRYYL